MMTPGEEEAFENGKRAAWISFLRQAVREVGQPESSLESWRIERAEAVVTLRRLCADGFGDNDWSDDLHLSDVIEKHMMRYYRDIR